MASGHLGGPAPLASQRRREVPPPRVTSEAGLAQQHLLLQAFAWVILPLSPIPQMGRQAEEPAQVPTESGPEPARPAPQDDPEPRGLCHQGQQLGQ